MQVYRSIKQRKLQIFHEGRNRNEGSFSRSDCRPKHPAGKIKEAEFFITLQQMKMERVRKLIFNLGMLLAISGLPLSRAMISTGMGLIILQAFLHPQPLHCLRAFLRNKSFLFPTLVFFIFLISGLWSDNLAYFAGKMQVKLPFLLLPYAFFTAPQMTKRKVHSFLAFFLLLISVLSLLTLINYALHYQEVTASYLKAKTLQVPFNHIRFSLMLSFSALTAFYLYREKVKLLVKWEPRFYLALSIFLFVFLHILSVRSGLLSFYLGAAWMLLLHIRQSRNRKKASLLLLLLLGIPVLAYFTVPTFHNKIEYMHHDLEQYRSGDEISRFSDSRRLSSWEAGIAVGNHSPLTGVGYGDFRDEVYRYYAREMPSFDPDTYIIPHNQLILTYAATGLFGLLLFIVFLLYPVFRRKAYRFYPFALINIIIWSSFMVESTLEIQIGTAFFLLFFLLTLKAQESECP